MDHQITVTWKPISREYLDAMIANGLAAYDEAVRNEWDRIKIEPEKWRCSPWGDEGGGFWAVAIRGSEVLWYNDIEEGFNLKDPRIFRPGRGKVIGEGGAGEFRVC